MENNDKEVPNAVSGNDIAKDFVKSEKFSDCFACHNPITEKKDAVMAKYGEYVCLKCFIKMTTPIRVMSKLGRNDLCDCGSGKKYKRCCLGNK